MLFDPVDGGEAPVLGDVVLDLDVVAEGLVVQLRVECTNTTWAPKLAASPTPTSLALLAAADPSTPITIVFIACSD